VGVKTSDDAHLVCFVESVTKIESLLSKILFFVKCKACLLMFIFNYLQHSFVVNIWVFNFLLTNGLNFKEISLELHTREKLNVFNIFCCNLTLLIMTRPSFLCGRQ